MDPSYTSLVRDLPKPTEEQIRRFAEFVSDAHSWYKHLPISPTSRFVFYLDPHAGQQMAHKSWGRTEFVDVPSTSAPFHYSTKPTEFYREQFGYLNYYAPYGTSFLVDSPIGRLDTSSSLGLFVVDDEGQRIPIPNRSVAAGSAYVTSVISALRSSGSPANWIITIAWAIIPGQPGARVRAPEVFDYPLETISDGLRSDVKAYISLLGTGSKDSIVREAERMMNEKIVPAFDKIRQSQLLAMERAMKDFVNLAS